jgi:hypothetical protein
MDVNFVFVIKDAIVKGLLIINGLVLDLLRTQLNILKEKRSVGNMSQKKIQTTVTTYEESCDLCVRSEICDRRKKHPEFDFKKHGGCSLFEMIEPPIKRTTPPKKKKAISERDENIFLP